MAAKIEAKWNYKHANPRKFWDKVFSRLECPYCDGTGKAPSSDGRTACGWCE